MQISFALDTANRKDVELAHATVGYMLGFIPLNQPATAVPAAPTAPRAPAATPAAQPAADALAANPPQAEAPKPAKGGKKKAAEAAAPALMAQAEGKLDFTAVKAKLQSYSDDARFGMNGVLAILNKYGVQRISALPEARYVEFVAEIDEALAGQPDPLA